MTSDPVDRAGSVVEDYQPIRCVLEMDADANIAVVVSPGCSVADVHDMLRLLTHCGGGFDHLTFVDEDTHDANPRT